ncbi:hypothetical protein ACEV6Q_08345 [Enterobacter ludwigii]|uniref:hypothetical protein n=1 Tax=Enterobacter ludwigii TaxID=299767 RepID=UPI003BEEF5F5
MQKMRIFSGNAADWREQMLIDGLMWQHTRKMMQIEYKAAALHLALAAFRQLRAKIPVAVYGRKKGLKSPYVTWYQESLKPGLPLALRHS